MKNEDIFITVFTPTYNRGYCIKNVYDSLVKQTFNHFEWLVINDGSTDNTSEVIQDCIAENKIKIVYLEQENGGKHRAINKAVRIASGKLFMIVDSDDDLKTDALEWIAYYESTIKEKKKFAGVSGLRCYRNGTIIGTYCKDNDCEYIDATNIERYKKNILQGDKAETYYTEVLKEFCPMPEFASEIFVSEGVIWNRIADKGLKIRWFNKAIYNCEYLADGISRNYNKKCLDSFNGYSLYTREFIHYDIGLFRKIKTTIVYCENARYRKNSYLEIAKNIKINVIYAYLAYMCSYISPLRYKLRKMRN